MLKEILTDWVTDYKDAAERNALAENPDESADYLISLFKAEVDKLTVIDDEGLKQIPKGFHYLLEYKEELDWILEAQLQHSKKQLLEKME